MHTLIDFYDANRTTYQIGNVRHLDGVVHHLGPSAPVALLEHRLVDDQCRFDVLGRLAHVPPVAPGPVRVLLFDHQARVVVLPAHLPVAPMSSRVARISTALV